MAIGTGLAILGSALIGGAIAAHGSNKQAEAVDNANKAQIEAAKMDPRQEAMIYGENGTGGLLKQYQDLGTAPHNGGITSYGNFNDAYLGTNAQPDISTLRDTALGQINGGTAAPTIKAPGQNSMDLSGSYDKFINGTPGANPYLTGAIQKGINQSSNAFGNMVSDAKNATQDVLGNIRGNSVLAGQYGGSRQGLAEGKAIESMNTQLGRAASQFGQNNTDAAVAAQAGAYETDSNRALGATQGLGAQQYNVAGQNAANQISTNALNSADKQLGTGNLSGLLAGAYGTAQNADNANINRATQVNGLLQPYLTHNNNVPAVQPTYANPLGAAVGGATAGVGLYNTYSQLAKPPAYGGNPGTNNPGAGANGFVNWTGNVAMNG